MPRSHRLLIAVVLVLLVSCGRGLDDSLMGTTTSTSTTTSSTSTTVPVTDTSTDEPVTTTTEDLPPPASITVWVEPVYVSAVEEAASDFTAALGIPVEVEGVASDMVLSRLRRGDVPADVFSGPGTWAGELVESEIVLPAGLEARAGEFLAVTLDAFTYQGVVYGAPYRYDTTVLFHDAELVPDAPSGFSQLKSICEEDPENTECAVVPIDRALHTYPFLSAQGGYLFGTTDEGEVDVTDVGIDSGGAVAGGEFLQGLVDEGVADDVPDGDAALDGFGAGTTLFMMAGAGEALATLPATARPRATATIPIMGGEEAVPLVTATGFYLAAASTQADAASVFLREYLLRTSTMDAFFAAEAGPPAFLATADAEDVAAATAAFRDSAETGVAVPPIPQIDGVLDVLRTAFSALYDRENDPEQVLSGAAGAIRVLVGGGPGDDG